jgi:hypothetical protein
MITEADLQPGDCLLYQPRRFSIFGHLIAFKTWHKISHCEMYVGDGISLASRDGIGVGAYETRWSELRYVLKTTAPLDFDALNDWFKTVNGQKYDWWGLLRFVYWGGVGAGDNGRMFCSEFLTRAYRAAGLDPFNGEDADAIVPFQFVTSNVFPVIRRVVSRETEGR